ncbi:M6 family metalloprotease domain-containing protein [Salipiger mangrovisoli]|uniref:M6 family metalloprotease domain-containing protein n=1 Tax=Salipiger mangrovisoli TaxID=2865933 RepID=A0ABR9X087_9RHOB|nr:M6 family metalloprotease domain-containing protein [Salipiger mangrovisoli]MBE9636911.1 M6 family metalloprotease domain-containing protein [Salipiger mangrovisoli]
MCETHHDSRTSDIFSSIFARTEFAGNWHNFFGQCSGGGDDRCCVAPAPELKKKIDKALKKMREAAPEGMEELVTLRMKPRVGFNDGLIVPGTELPLGTPPMAARNFAAQRAPLSGDVRVAVVLAEFSDKSFGSGAAQRFKDLFFSTGEIATGSVKEYFADVTNGAINIIGEVAGPFTMPDTLAHYSNGQSGTGSTTPNARDMARDAATAANPTVNFGPYDNDGDGFVDAYVVVHAGSGAEQTGSGGDIWSHKWVMRSEFNADGTKLFAYLTIPEDALLGVCAHELGHLLFGFPDLYDTDQSSEGVGNWCLMGGGSWNGGGNTPAHPSAWCKANQGWVTVTNVTTNGTRSIPDVKTSHEVFRLWKDGGAGQEYFLVENRQRDGYDADLPGDGLLIWHIDEAISTNSDEAHPKVALEQADGTNGLGSGANRGDAGDPYPGSAASTVFDRNSTPNSRSYAGSDTCVAVAGISASAPTMSAELRVRCGKSLIKDFSDKRIDKTIVADKIPDKRFEKPLISEKPLGIDKRPEKPITDKSVGLDKGDFDKGNFEKPGDKLREGGFDRPGGGGLGGGLGGGFGVEDRLAAIEAALASITPFIDASLRPDLDMSALAGEEDLRQMQSAASGNRAQAKRLLDTRQG